jgi:hypothetical protein
LAYHKEYLKIRHGFNDTIKIKLTANAKKFKSQYMQQNTNDFYFNLNNEK